MVQSLWHIHHVYIYTWRNSHCSPCSLCWLPFVSPLYPLSTYLAPSSCDRNRPSPSQVACKLTPFAPLHPVDPPHPNSQNPANPAPNNDDDLGNILALGVQNKYIVYVYIHAATAQKANSTKNAAERLSGSIGQGSGQWAVGSGQWAVGSGQWAVGRGQSTGREVGSGKRAADGEH